jgi:hypothetical protein
VRRAKRDATFAPTLSGPTYANPLFVEDGPRQRETILVATEQDVVYAIDARTGEIFWQRTLGLPARASQHPCAKIDPLGITGTPTIDLTTRTLYVDAVDATTEGGYGLRHLIYALSIDDGATRAGWPVDVQARINGFHATDQNQRGALLIHQDVLYVPYGAHSSGCGNYSGWVIGIPTANPAGATGWRVAAPGSGIWAPSGVASDGTSLFVATGNSYNAPAWSGSDALLRLDPGPSFSSQPKDYFSPSNWKVLDSTDFDFGANGALLLDMPDSTPPKLAIAISKAGVVFLADRANLGGIGYGDGASGEGLYSQKFGDGYFIGAPATFTAQTGAYLYVQAYSTAGTGNYCPPGVYGDFVALRLDPGSPPSVRTAWCVRNDGYGSPIVTTTNGKDEAVVWTLSVEAGNRLRAFDAITGEALFGAPVDGGAADAASDDAQLGSLHRFMAPIIAKGRLYVAGDDRLYAFDIR